MQSSVTDYGMAQGGSSVVRGLLSETTSAHQENGVGLANSGGPSAAQSTQMNIVDSQQITARGPNRLQEPGQAPNQAEAGADENEQNSEEAQAQAWTQQQAQTPANEEKMKQLKQFIHMIDLLNGLEQDQRQQYIVANEYSIGNGPPAESKNGAAPGAGNLGQSPGRRREGKPESANTNQVGPNQMSQGVPGGGPRSEADVGQAQIKRNGQDGTAQALQKDQLQAMVLQEQIENLRQCQQIDINIWKHFQSLLKKNLHNPYLREALMKRATAMHNS